MVVYENKRKKLYNILNNFHGGCKEVLIGAVQEFKLKSELEETIVLLKYLENLHGKPKRNKRIDRFKPGGPGMETFSWLARG